MPHVPRKVAPKTPLNPSQIDRFTEIKQMTVGYFEAQNFFAIGRTATHYDAASLFSVADAQEADYAVGGKFRRKIPDVEFEILEKKVRIGKRSSNPVHRLSRKAKP